MNISTPLPSVAVVIAIHNNLPGLKSCLLALQRQSHPPDRVYVADDGSGPEIADFLKTFQSNLKISHVWQEHRGYRRSVSLNNALRILDQNYVLFLDGDEIPHSRFIADHLRFARRGTVVLGTRCGLLGFRESGLFHQPSLGRLLLLFVQGRLINDSMAITVSVKTRFVGLLKGLRLPFGRFARCSVREVHGGNMAAWREDLVRVNGYDEDFLGWGFEDQDLVKRLLQAGVMTHQLSFQGICFHLESTSSKTPSVPNKQMFNSDRPARCVNGITRPTEDRK